MKLKKKLTAVDCSVEYISNPRLMLHVDMLDTIKQQEVKQVCISYSMLAVVHQSKMRPLKSLTSQWPRIIIMNACIKLTSDVHVPLPYHIQSLEAGDLGAQPPR